MRTARRTLLLVVALWSLLAADALASSSIAVGIPRKIGVQQPFTLTVTGFGDQAPLSRPDARFLVTVFGRSSGPPLDRQTCLNPPPTASGNPGVGFLLVSQYVPAGAVNLTFPSFKMPQVGRWTLCAKISGYNVSGPNTFALAFPAATVLVTQERVRLEETAVSVSLAPASVAADGAGFSLATILATRGGQGLAGRTLSIQPDPDADAPRTVVCDTRTGGALLWPAHRFGDGTRSVTGFDVTTDSTGEKQLKLLTGSQPGTFSLSATLKGQASIFDLAQLTVRGGGGGQDPASLDERLTRAGRDFMEGASPRFAAAVGLRSGQHGGTLAREQALLEWLAQARAGGGGLNGLAFGPIRSADGRAGILVYPQGQTVRTPSGAVTPGIGGARMVIDVDALAQAVGASQTLGGIFRFPDLSLPQFAGAVQPLLSWQGSGASVVGFATPSKNEDLAYFGYPEPPPLGSDGRHDFDACLDLDLGGFVAEVHSPLRLTFAASDGNELGLAPGGPVLGIPGGFVSAPRGGVARYGIPAGAASSLRLLGTGSGRATVVIWPPPTPRGGPPSVFALGVKAGQSGMVRLGGAAAPSALTFAGKRVRAVRGVGLRLKTPRKVAAGKRFTVVVKDQFGRAAAGVTVSGGGQRTTDARGRATLKAPRRGRSVTVVAGGGGFRKVSMRLKLR